MEPEDDGLDLPPFDWEKLFRRLFLIGLSLWVLGGTISTIINGYFVYFSGPLFGSGSGSETATKATGAIYTLSITVQLIAFRVWVASGLLLVFLWFRATTSHVEPPTPN